MSNRMEVAREGWGADMPEWIEALVRACDETSQNRVAVRVGYTGAVVSEVIRNRYKGRTDRFEERFRAIFLDGAVACPALGEIGAEACLRWRDRGAELNSSSPAVVRMFRACAMCPRNRDACVEEEA